MMKNLLVLECSPYGDGSLGARVIRDIVAGLGERHPGSRVVLRQLGANPLPALSEDYARALMNRAPAGDPAVACSEQLIGEVEQCDGLLISTPMHNFTVPAALKLWIDYVLRVGRTFMATPEGKFGLLEDRPALVLVRSGGACTGEAARQPDFLTPYLRHALATIGIKNSDFHYLAGVAPGQDDVAVLRQSTAGSPLLSLFLGEPA